MNTVKRLLQGQQSYERLDEDSPVGAADHDERSKQEPPFSWPVYGVFLLLGVAMLWAWNAFMAAAPYFQQRFRSSKTITSNFQAAELSVSTVANLGSVLVLAKLQANASYPKRIVSSLLINIVTFTLLAASTRTALGVAAGVYLGFLMVMVFATSLATGFMQNGSFAFVAGYRRPEYMQSIMFGQAVAGVLPPIVQIGSVLSANEANAEPGQSSSISAFAYFLTATGVSALTLVAFAYLALRRSPTAAQTVVDNAGETEPMMDDASSGSSSNSSQSSRRARSVPLLYLAKRLFYSAAAVFLTFAVTMVFPVFTQRILTTNPSPPPLLRDAAFIPLGLLVWNAGDLVGRLLPLSERISLATRPKILLLISVARIIFIPIYLLCNIQGADTSPDVASNIRDKAMPDIFYLLIVQLPFGLSNGYLGSCCMMGAGNLVEESDREAAGGFMGVMLVSGLAVGSLCSFLVGNG